jgi:hypothetical protein
MNKKTFNKIIKQNYKEVSTWEKWKQKYIISAEAFETGKLIKD